MRRSLTSTSVSIKVSFESDHKNEILDLLRKFAADKMIRVNIEELLSTPGSTEEDNVVVVADNDQICDQHGRGGARNRSVNSKTNCGQC